MRKLNRSLRAHFWETIQLSRLSEAHSKICRREEASSQSTWEQILSLVSFECDLSICDLPDSFSNENCLGFDPETIPQFSLDGKVVTQSTRPKTVSVGSEPRIMIRRKPKNKIPVIEDAGTCPKCKTDRKKLSAELEEIQGIFQNGLKLIDRLIVQKEQLAKVS